MIEKIPVHLGDRSYEIIVGEKILGDAGHYILPLLTNKRTVIITDENVAHHQLTPLNEGLKNYKIDFETIILPAGEATKSMSHVEKLLDQLLELKVERKDCIIAFGGGVIGDLVGFVASIYLRGIRFIQIPTTLLAQVDSSVGGKTGVNCRYGKNLIGSFHQPSLVLTDVASLSTLDQRHIIAGYAEIAKYGLINDVSFFAWLEKNGKDLIEGSAAQKIKFRTEAIIKSCHAKATIVANDEKESGQRALLNLGHTFAHALEAENGYNDNLYHGEAVAMGIILAFKLSVNLSICPDLDLNRVENHFYNIGFRKISDMKFNIDNLLHHMKADKKMSSGKLTFIVASAIGKSYLSNDIDMSDVKAVLNQSIMKAR
jgi:3-dehydroquinate synthase